MLINLSKHLVLIFQIIAMKNVRITLTYTVCVWRCLASCDAIRADNYNYSTTNKEIKNCYIEKLKNGFKNFDLEYSKITWYFISNFCTGISFAITSASRSFWPFLSMTSQQNRFWRNNKVLIFQKQFFIVLVFHY